MGSESLPVTLISSLIHAAERNEKPKRDETGLNVTV